MVPLRHSTEHPTMSTMKATFLAVMLAGFATANLPAQVDGHFSSWSDVPAIIDSINADNYREPLKQLHQLTRIKLGWPHMAQDLSKKEHRAYILSIQEKWKQWWESTGQPVSKQKELEIKVDPQAFQIAWGFLGTQQEPPQQVLPVWIPKVWNLHVTFTNSDYQAMEHEIWVIDRQSTSARLTKLRGDYSRGEWGVVLTQFDDLSPERADQILKALCYVHRYAPSTGTPVPHDKPDKLYYPYATLHLRDDKNRILWNTEGYDFSKSRPEYGDGESGRSHYFLRSIFSGAEHWQTVSKPTSDQLAPYRNLLSINKPYFFGNAADIVQLFGQSGGMLEKESLLEWVKKQQAATDPNMGWEVRSDDFSTSGTVNVAGSTKHELKNTLAEIRKIEARVNDKGTK
jgi:hypothetical protein